MGASPKGHQAWETIVNSGNGVSLHALKVSGVQVHMLIGVTGTSASLRREPFSIWPWHPGSTGGYLFDVSIFWAILVDFSSVQQFHYLCKAHL